MPGLSITHIILILVILAIALIFFGPGRLPEIGGAMGKSVKEFRDSISSMKTELTPTDTVAAAPPPPPAPPSAQQPVEPPVAGTQPPPAPPASTA